jgi:hypothetical protein
MSEYPRGLYPEHEEALRTEFTQFVHLEHDTLRVQARLGGGRGLSSEHYEQLLRQQHEIQQRWIDGPHTDAWTSLHRCYREFVEHPEVMQNLARGADDPRDRQWTPLARRHLQHAGPLADTTLRLCAARDHAERRR